MNLKDLGDLVLSNDVLDFILKEDYKWITNEYASPFLIELICDDIFIETRSIDVTEDLDVVSKLDLDLRRQYHIRFSIVSDFTVLTQEAKDRLCNNPVVVSTILKTFNCSLGYHTSLMEEGNILTNKELSIIQKAIKNNDPNVYSGVPKTYMLNNIAALRSE